MSQAAGIISTLDVGSGSGDVNLSRREPGNVGCRRSSARATDHPVCTCTSVHQPVSHLYTQSKFKQRSNFLKGQLCHYAEA